MRVYQSRDEVTWELRKLCACMHACVCAHTQVIHTVPALPQILLDWLAQDMKWAQHVAFMGETWNIKLVGKLKQDQLRDIDVGNRIILRWISEKQVVNMWTGLRENSEEVMTWGTEKEMGR